MSRRPNVSSGLPYISLLPEALHELPPTYTYNPSTTPLVGNWAETHSMQQYYRTYRGTNTSNVITRITSHVNNPMVITSHVNNAMEITSHVNNAMVITRRALLLIKLSRTLK